MPSKIPKTHHFNFMCSSVVHFEEVAGHFKMTANPKQEQPRQQSNPWTIDDQDLERNKAKVNKDR